MRLALPVLLLAMTLSACGGGASVERFSEGPQALVDLAVEVGARGEDTLDVARSTFQTDKAGATWYDAVADPQADAAMGFTVADVHVLDGWRWWSVSDSAALGPEDMFRGVARPDQAVRSYVQRDSSGLFMRFLNLLNPGKFARLTERVTLLDNKGALLIEVADSIGTVRFRPLRSDAKDAAAFEVRDLDNVLVFARANQIVRDSLVVPEGPIWTAVASEGGTVGSTSVRSETPTAGRDVSLRMGELEFATPGAAVVATGPTPEAAASAARSALADAQEIRERRQARMVKVLNETPFDTEDDAYDKSFRWALLSLDALVHRDSSRATIASGLPGATPKTFPSVAWTVGAFLASGQWELARSVLTTLGAAQRFDRRIDVLAAAPDLVPPTGPPVFANADATALFVAAAGDYVRTTGDEAIVHGGPNFWYKINFALRGLYESDGRNGNPTDSLGFLRTRTGRGTWLDDEGIGERGPRRGATVEGQAALVHALGAAAAFARIMGVSQRSGTEWYADTASVLLADVQQRFVVDSVLTDVLLPAGSAAPTAGPNALLALSMFGAMPTAQRAALARVLAAQLVHENGVSSLPESDSTFLPFLKTPVPGTIARTRGAIWTWLTGPVATLMAQTGGSEPASALLAAQSRMVLDRGVVGAIAELVSTHTHDGADGPEQGGAPVQPWSLAGFVEGTLTGLVGASYPSADTLLLEPRLPESWGTTSTRFRLNIGSVGVRMTPAGSGMDIELTPDGPFAASSAVRIRVAGSELTVPLQGASADSSAANTVVVRFADGAVSVDGATVQAGAAPAPIDAWDGFSFVTPNPDLVKESAASAYQALLLDRDRLLRTSPRAKSVLTRTDPQGDDWGSTGTFTYPQGFPAGVLDATYLEISRDDSTTYFRAEFGALVGSGSLGFSPTFVAFALDSDSDGGANAVGRNAKYDLGEDGYEYVIYVGDGLLLEDQSGRAIATIPPGAEPLWDTETASLTIAMPTSVLPALPPGTRVTMLVGAMDPEGVGAFRSVTRQPTAETGGGKVDQRAPHVYDVVSGSIR